jgi:hypothetical protein
MFGLFYIFFMVVLLCGTEEAVIYFYFDDAGECARIVDVGGTVKNEEETTWTRWPCYEAWS